jgi:hypothetical protein
VAGQLFDAHAIAKWDAYGSRKRSSHRVFNNDDQQYTEQPLGFEGGLGLLFLDMNVGFDPVEFADLLSAVCGLDLLRDNRPDEPEQRANGMSPPDRQTNRKPAVATSQRSL